MQQQASQQHASLQISGSGFDGVVAMKNFSLANHPAFAAHPPTQRRRLQKPLASSRSQGKLPLTERVAKCEGLGAAVETLPLSQYKLLKTCQMMVDAAAMMQCKLCSISLGVEAFHDHVVAQKCLTHTHTPHYVGH